MDDIPIDKVVFLEPSITSDVAHWPIASKITDAGGDARGYHFEHTKAGQWPLGRVFGDPASIEGTVALLYKFGGVWYCGGVDWLGAGRTSKGLEQGVVEFGRDQCRVSPMDASWPGPKAGDTVGFLVTTPSSLRIGVRTVNERSNIRLFTWS